MSALPAGFRNCHARGVDSVVVSRYADGRPRLRLFVANADHELWRNDRPGGGEATMSLALHAHRSALTLVRVHGPAHQVTARRSGHGVAMNAWHYKSQILTGQGAFTLCGSQRFAVDRPFVFDAIRMAATDLHTIYVPNGVTAAWFVHEHEQVPDYDEVLYSDDNLVAFDFTGMYTPMDASEAAAVLAANVGAA